MSASISVAHAATPSPLPTRLLGQTGVAVTLFGLGGEGVLRTYDRAAEAVRVIQRALDAGFTVADLARVLKQRDAGGAPCREVLEIARARLDELDIRIRSLMALRRELRQVVDGWEKRLEGLPPGRRAGLLDKLGAINPFGAASRRAGPHRAARASARNPNRGD